MRIMAKRKTNSTKPGIQNISNKIFKIPKRLHNCKEKQK